MTAYFVEGVQILKHIVFILGSYYPNYSAVGMCLGNLADCFSKNYKVSIVSMRTNLDEPDNEVYNGQEIYRIATPEMLLRYKAVKNDNKLLLQLLRIWRTGRMLLGKDLINQALVDAYTQGINRIKEPIDIIIPTCNPMESGIAALDYKAKDSQRVKILPVLFDLFAERAFLNRFKWNKKIKNNRAIEKKLFEISEHVFYVHNWSEYLERNFKKYTGKFTEIEHPLLVLPERFSGMQITNKVPIVVYTGTVDIINRNPKWAVTLLAEAAKKNKFEAHFYSFGNGEQVITAAAKHSNCIHEMGRVTTQVAAKARSEADLLLSLGNKNTSQIPSKLFEYIATGKPIIHLAVSNNDPAISLLASYPYALVLVNDSGDDCTVQLVDFIKKYSGKELDFPTISKLFPEALPSTTCNTLGGVLLTFTGSLTRNYVEPDYLLRLLSGCSDYKLKLFTTGSAVTNIYKYPKAYVILNDWISKSELALELETSNVLVNIAEVSGRNVSSKIFSYMLVGKPILHIYYADDDVNLQYLRKYSLALCIKADDMRLNENCTMLAKWCVFVKNRNSDILKLNKEFEKCSAAHIAKEIQCRF